MSYYVECTDKSGFKSVVSGCGRNKGTWDSHAPSLRTAQRWAKELRGLWPTSNFKVMQE